MRAVCMNHLAGTGQMSGEPAGSWVQCRVYFYGDKVLCLVCVAPFTFVSSFLPLLSLSLAGGNV